MRRMFLAAGCAALLLSAAPAASGLEAPLHGHRAANVIHASALRQLLLRGPVEFVPLAGTLPPGGGVISLDISTFEGDPEVGATVRWVVDRGNEVGWNEGEGSTDGSGHVLLEGVPAADPAEIYNAEIVVRPAIPADVDDYYHLDQMTWPAEGYSAGLQPGCVPVTVVRTGDSEWGSWSTVKTMLWTKRPTSEPYAETHVARDQISVDPITKVGYPHTITTGTESVAGGTLYFWQDQGMELPVTGMTVSPGMKASPVTVDQAQAQRVWMRGWGSGKPGSRTQLCLDNYPAGWDNAIRGQADYPNGAAVADFGTVTTTGGTGTWLPVTIPRTVLPGYQYYLWADRADGWFGLATSFQTCTLKPSSTAVASGRTVVLSGVVPVAGHRGNTAGTPKWVTIYRTTSSKVAAKGQPSVRGGSATTAGWTKIARVRTDGLGKYRKASIQVRKTSWYCAWYEHDAEYWSAWTSVTKVLVK